VSSPSGSGGDTLTCGRGGGGVPIRTDEGTDRHCGALGIHVLCGRNTPPISLLPFSPLWHSTYFSSTLFSSVALNLFLFYPFLLCGTPPISLLPFSPLRCLPPGGGGGVSNLHHANQREGMGLLEYQAMPSLRDAAHDGWLCTYTI
jgi:hypothetical protein